MKSILYNTQANATIGKIYIGTYNDRYPHGKLNEGIIELEVIDTPMPPYDHDTQRVVNRGYLLFEGKWVRSWEVIPLTDKEIAAREWGYPQWSMRLRVIDEPTLKLQMANVLVYWDEQGFTRDVKDGYIRLYCNEVINSHRVWIDTANEWLEQLNEQVYEETRPSILN